MTGSSKLKQDDGKRFKFDFGRQFRALFIKVAIYQSRQMKTNICNLIFPLFLMLILFLLQVIVGVVIEDTIGSYVPPVDRPPLQAARFSIPMRNASQLCLELPPTPSLYFDANMISASNGNEQVGVFGGVNPLVYASLGVPLPADYVDSNGPASYLLGNATMTQVLASQPAFFAAQQPVPTMCPLGPLAVVPTFEYVDTKEDLDADLFDAWYTSKSYIGGFNWHTVDIENNKYDVSLYYNRTLNRGGELPLLLNMVTNAIFRTIRGDPVGLANTLGDYDLSLGGVMDYPKPEESFTFDLISLLGSPVYIYIFSLLLPVFLSHLVREKEQGLREIMKMMGLKMHVYWVVSYLWFLVLYIITAALIYVFGMILQFKFFLLNDFLVVALVLFVWGNVVIALAFFFSVFLGKGSTSTVVGYVFVFASGTIAAAMIGIYFDPTNDISPEALFAVQLFPPFTLYRALEALARSVRGNQTGMRISEITAWQYDISTVLIFMAVQWAVLMILAIYLELVLPVGPGTKKHPCFFFPRKCYEKKIKMKERDEDEPEDVALEREQTIESASNPDSVVRVLNLSKVYPGSGRSQSHVAVDGLYLNIRNNECFGFLGPNGAGKSTTINVLCGYQRATSGTATIVGLDINSNVDQIHARLGVCPQDNLIFGVLTAAEHLQFYGRLKNLSGKELEEQVQYWLKQVNLHNTKSKMAKQFSGGMKRRLCVAMAMIGNPSVVLLDEPTTGLDPESRNNLWTVINKAKEHCAIILTTHSMEEAEALCDRVGIFVNGRMRAIGPSADLKRRFGRGYKMVITTPMDQETRVRRYIKKIVKDLILVSSLAGTQSFEFTRDGMKLSEFFRKIRAVEKKYQILDWGISNTTLEEVFLAITLKDVTDDAEKFRKKKKKKKKEKKKGKDTEELVEV